MHIYATLITISNSLFDFISFRVIIYFFVSLLYTSYYIPLYPFYIYTSLATQFNSISTHIVLILISIIASIRATTTAAPKKVTKAFTSKVKAFAKAKASTKAKAFTKAKASVAKASAVKAFTAKVFKAKAPFRITKFAPPRNSRDYIYVSATPSPLPSSRTISPNVIKETSLPSERRYRIENTLPPSLFRLSKALDKIAKLEKQIRRFYRSRSRVSYKYRYKYRYRYKRLELIKSKEGTGLRISFLYNKDNIFFLKVYKRYRIINIKYFK